MRDTKLQRQSLPATVTILPTAERCSGIGDACSAAFSQSGQRWREAPAQGANICRGRCGNQSVAQFAHRERWIGFDSRSVLATHRM